MSTVSTTPRSTGNFTVKRALSRVEAFVLNRTPIMPVHFA